VSAVRRVREELLQRLGRMPARPPAVPPRVERRFQIDDIEYEKWRWDGARDALVAWFLRRAGVVTPAPAILAVHPHGRQFEIAKSMVAGLVGEPSRAYGLAAARAGFAVLAPDLPGFEERRPPLAERKRSYALQGEHYERLLAFSALVQGETLQGWILADLAAAVDVLAIDPRVDASRIGVLGQSLGGQEAVFSMLYDERLRAGVASCGLSRLRLLVDRRISHNAALYVPGLLPDLDFETLVPALAPRPLCIIAGERDLIYPVDGVRAVEAAARAAYGAAGAAAHLRCHYFDGGHDLPGDALDAALAWLHEVMVP
jgi:dienelactone hydrolase